MTRLESEALGKSGDLSNTEAASLIEIILANVSTSAPRVVVPDSLKSLADYFPAEFLARV